MPNKNVTLIQTVKHKDLNAVCVLLNQGVDVNERGKYGKSALHFAVENQCIEIAQQLIKYGACVDAVCDSRQKDKRTPLIAAVMCRNKPIINLLLNNGASVNIKRLNTTPLHCAVSSGCEQSQFGKRKHIQGEDKNLVEMLLSRGANINARDRIGQTALHIAAQNGFAEVMTLLLQYDVDVNAKDLEGNTPIHSTVYSNELCFEEIRNRDIVRRHIAEFLISKKADINAINNKKETVLHIAVQCGCFQVVELLLQYNADVNVKDSKGNTAIHRTVTFNSMVTEDTVIRDIVCRKIAALLISQNADINIVNKEGRTVLHEACLSGRLEVVELLLNYDVDVNAKDSEGNTPLHCVFYYYSDNIKIDASVKFRKKIVELLLNKEADIHAKNDNGETVLHIAVNTWSKEVVEMLLQYNADVNAVDYCNFTPLHCTVFYSSKMIFNPRSFMTSCMISDHMRKEMAELLILNQANVNVKNEHEKTALYIATQYGYTEVVELLLQSGAVVDSSMPQPIHIAAQHGYTKILKLLLNAKADVNARDLWGRTPLHLAVQKQSKEAVTMLLKSGADIFLKCNERMSSFQYIPHVSQDYDLVCILISYVVKLHILSNRKYIKKFGKSIPKSENVLKSLVACKKEIDNMRVTPVNNTRIPIINILMKNAYVVSKYAKNENVIHLLKSNELNAKFPIYASQIIDNFCKGTKRKNLIVKCSEILYLISSKLTCNDLENICDYLSDIDLENFIFAFSEPKEGL